MSLLLFSVTILVLGPAVGVSGSIQDTPLPGSWELLLKNAGIASMHTAITHFNTAIFLDRTLVGPSQIALPKGHECRINPSEHDCTARSVMFDLGSNTVRPLDILTDTWCSSGQFFANGTMVQTGGDLNGFTKIRTLAPCPASGDCDWVESTIETLTDGRWYSTNQLLPEGSRQIVVGGRGVFTYEFVPKRFPGEGAFPLQLLVETNDRENDNYYPFVHLLPNGHLFIFANRDSILLDYTTGKVVQQFPTIPGEPRNYPLSGSSVLLPLSFADGYSTASVLICGGGQAGAFNNPNGFNLPASQTCGRLEVTTTTTRGAGSSNSEPQWLMETMPLRRVMGDMVLLPTGDVLLINGAQNGTAGWGKASNPALNPVRYQTFLHPAANRFQVLAPSTIPRVYHSTANLRPDGRILVAGSNTHQYDTFTGVFPTELRVEAFSPQYLSERYDFRRPQITAAPARITYGKEFTVTFSAPSRKDPFELHMASAPYTTHAYSQGQRLLILQVSDPVPVQQAGAGAAGASRFTVTVTAPPNANVAPPQYYMLFPMQAGTPGNAVWIQMV
ncbi:unnamed protein product [Sphagnum troendelagicum]